MRSSAAFGVALALGTVRGACGRPGGAGGGDAGAVPIDAGTSDVSPDAPRLDIICTAGSLSGELPFARVVEGEAVLDPIGTTPRTRIEPLRATLWFPAGRVAGADAMLSFPSEWPITGQYVSGARIDADGAVSFAINSYYGARWLHASATLDAGADTLRVVVSDWNLTGVGTDRRDSWEGAATLCATTEPVAAPTLEAADDTRRHAPVAPIWLVPSVPIDESSLSVVASIAGDAVAVDARVQDNAVVITTAAAFPPGATVDLDVTGTRDLLGRPVSLAIAPEPLTTSESATDLTFETAPPAGAISGAVTWTKGALRIGDRSALIALDDPPGTTLRIASRYDCRAPTARIAIVAADGSLATVSLECAVERGVPPTETVVARPSPGDLWLAVWNPIRQRPPFSPAGVSLIWIESITAE